MNQSANTTANTIEKDAGGESYRWKTLPPIGTIVKGCHLVPIKVRYLDICVLFLSPAPKKWLYILTMYIVHGISDHLVFVKRRPCQ